MQLFVADRQSIVAGEWLTDAVIDAAQVLLKEHFPEMGGLQRTTLGHTLTYAVERGEFVQIVNVRGNHWSRITVSNIGCQLNHLNVYDSIPHGDISLRAKQQIAALLFTQAKAITLNFPDVLIVAYFLLHLQMTLCTGFDPVEIKYDQKLFRDHLLQCIQNQHFTPFPCTVINKRPQAGHQQVVPFFCQCRQPEGGKMAQCDGCKEWYHDECANFPDDIESVA